MKFESYDPQNEHSDGGLMVHEGDESTGEFETVNTGSHDDFEGEKTVDDVLERVARGESEEVEERESFVRPSGTEKLQTEIQSGIDALREKIEKKIEKRNQEEVEAYIEDGERTVQKEERAREEEEAHEEDIKRDEAVLENARQKWREEVARGVENKEQEGGDQAMRLSYEELRAGAFSRIAPLERAIRSLEHAIALENDELTYLHQKEAIVRTSNPVQYEQTKIEILDHEEKIRENEYLLNKRKATYESVSKFENALWGDTPQDLFRNSEVLWADINNCESRKDLLSLFDTWGALPGVDYTQKPVTNKEEVERFLSTMDGKSKEELTEEASRLFENVHLRNLVLELPEREMEAQNAEKQAESSRIEEIKARLRKGAHFSREAVPQHVEKELDSLHREEQDLTEAKPILQSKMFRFAPFLMNLTQSGREKLSLLKRVGLDKKSVGASNKNLEFARVFRLKAVREKEASMQGAVGQRFADDLKRRRWSEDREFYDSTHPYTAQSAESIRDKQDLERGDTRRKNTRNIERSLAQQGGSGSFFEKILSSFFGNDNKREVGRGATFDDFITPDMIAKEGRAQSSIPHEEPEIQVVRPIIQKAEEAEEVLSKEEESVYTETPKKEKAKKTVKPKTTGKPKKRSPRKRLL